MVRRGRLGRVGTSGSAGCCEVRLALAWTGRPWSGIASRGMAGKARQAPAWAAEAGLRRGMAGMARMFGEAMHAVLRQGCQGRVVPGRGGDVGLGGAGSAGRGSQGLVWSDCGPVGSGGAGMARYRDRCRRVHRARALRADPFGVRRRASTGPSS